MKPLLRYRAVLVEVSWSDEKGVIDGLSHRVIEVLDLKQNYPPKYIIYNRRLFEFRETREFIKGECREVIYTDEKNCYAAPDKDNG